MYIFVLGGSITFMRAPAPSRGKTLLLCPGWRMPEGGRAVADLMSVLGLVYLGKGCGTGLVEEVGHHTVLGGSQPGQAMLHSGRVRHGKESVLQQCH